MRRLIDLTLGIKSPRIPLTRGSKEDFTVWQQFLSEFNGRLLFLSDALINSHQLQLYTDASGAIGFGALFGKHWCYGAGSEN